MSAKKLFLSYFIFLAFIYIMYLAFFNPQIATEPLKYDSPTLFYDYKGVTHTHSNVSSGSGSIAEIAEAAKAAKLDFIYITDLNPFDHNQETQEGRYGDLLLFVAGEYSYLDSKVLNYHNKTSSHLQSPGRVQVTFSDLFEKSNIPEEYGWFVLSHPFKPGYRWNGEIPEGLRGIEIINLKSLWQRWWLESKASFLWTFAIFPLNSRLSLVRLLSNPVKNLRLWDDLNKQDRLTLGFVGNDAEALTKIFNKYPIEFPDYQTIFAMASNHVLLKGELTGEFSSDKEKIQSALAAGQFYLSFDFVGNPKGFELYLEKDGRKIIAMGREVDIEPPAELVINVPENVIVPVRITLVKDGEVFMTSSSKNTTVNLNLPGHYRVEVKARVPLPFPDHGRWVPWIYTNPFLVRQANN